MIDLAALSALMHWPFACRAAAAVPRLARRATTATTRMHHLGRGRLSRRHLQQSAVGEYCAPAAQPYTCVPTEAETPPSSQHELYAADPESLGVI